MNARTTSSSLPLQIRGRALGDDTAFVQHQQAIAELTRARNVVRDHDQRGAAALLEIEQQPSISSAVIGSSPALGSSTSRMRGSSAIARASPARFRMPPDSVRRHLVELLAPGRRRRAFRARARESPLAPAGVATHRERDVLAHRDRVEQRRVLEQEAHLAPHAESSGPSSALISSPSTNTRPLSGRTRPMMWRSVTLLPVPLRPRMQKPAPRRPRTTRRPAPAGRRSLAITSIRASTDGQTGVDSAASPSPTALGKMKKMIRTRMHVGHDDEHRRQHDRRASRRGPRLRSRSVVKPRYEETVAMMKPNTIVFSVAGT